MGRRTSLVVAAGCWPALLFGLWILCGTASAADLEVVHPPWLSPGAEVVVSVTVSQDGAALAFRTVELALDGGPAMARSRTDMSGRA